MHLKGRLERWVMELQEFQYSVIHKPGKLHNNADALSRLAAHGPSNEKTLTESEMATNTTSTLPCRRI